MSGPKATNAQIHRAPTDWVLRARDFSDREDMPRASILNFDYERSSKWAAIGWPVRFTNSFKKPLFYLIILFNYLAAITFGLWHATRVRACGLFKKTLGFQPRARTRVCVCDLVYTKELWGFLSRAHARLWGFICRGTLGFESRVRVSGSVFEGCSNFGVCVVTLLCVCCFFCLLCRWKSMFSGGRRPN